MRLPLRTLKVFELITSFVNRLRRTGLFWQVASLALLLIGFCLLELRCLDSFPAPRVDEPWLMQPSWEWLKHGHPGLPMFRHLGSNIQNYWITSPLLFAAGAVVFKLFGLGLLQARAFNLLLASIILLCLYLVVRRYTGHWTAFTAALLLSLDGNFLYWSRVYRSDIPTVALCWIAILFAAYARERAIFWFLSGLLAVSALMIHPNGLYVFGIILVWMVMQEGFRAPLKRSLPAFAAGSVIPAIPCMIFLYRHWIEFVRQWSTHQARLRGARLGGLWLNLIQEWKRYMQWPQGWFALGHPRPGLAIIMSIVVILVLVFSFREVIRRRFKDVKTWSSGYLLAGLFISFLFLTLSDSRKAPYYLPYVTPWLAACIAMQGAALVRWISAPRSDRTIWNKAVTVGALGFMLLVTFSLFHAAVVLYREIPSLSRISCTETIKQVRALIPPGTIPTGRPVYWLAFADDEELSDKFVVFNRKMKHQPTDKPYALIVDEGGLGCKRGFHRLQKNHPEYFEKIGEVPESCYGKLSVFLMQIRPDDVDKE